MKQKVLLFALLAQFFILSASAYDAYIGGIYYNLDTTNKTATVTYSKSSFESGASYSGSVTIPTTITYNNISYKVTAIGYEAFWNSKSLTYVSIPSSITSIGEEAFYNCVGLTSVTIPASVNKIDRLAFQSCSKLTNINIQSSNALIELNAFQGTPWYTSWYSSQPSGLCYVGNILFRYKGTVPNNTTIVVKEGTTSIAGGAFEDCSGSFSVQLPQSLSSIGSSAFARSGLKAISFPEHLTYLGTGAFYSCTKMTTIEIPVFTESGGSAHEGIHYWTGWGMYICWGCTNLNSASLAEGTKIVYSSMFADCTNLTNVTLPSTITSIYKSAFEHCNNLSTVKVNMLNPPVINSETFTNRFLATLIVPKGRKAAYEAKDYWNEFKHIYAMNDVNNDDNIDVLDVVDIARFVVGTPSQSFIEYLADVNNDSDVNLGDAVALVNDIAGEQNFVKARSAPREVDTGDALTLSEGNGCLSLNLENERYYSAFQFDIYAPEGTGVTQMLLNAERKQQHQLLYNKVEEGHYRVAVLSTSNNEFIGNNGELLNIALTGAGNSKVSVCNIHFFDAEGNDYRFEDIYGASPTSIRQIDNGELRMDNSIYNLVGQRLNKMQRGVNIVGGKKMIVK